MSQLEGRYPLSELALIGNCQASALVSAEGEVVFSCMPRFDSEPIFASLLDEAGGSFRIASASGEKGRIGYLENTNVAETIFESEGGAFRVLDFLPRYFQGQNSAAQKKAVRPLRLIRIVEPLSGKPRVRVDLRPIAGWSKEPRVSQVFPSHIRFEGGAVPLHLFTNAPVSYLGEQSFVLQGRLAFVLSYGEELAEPALDLADRELAATTDYWCTWVKHCTIPSQYQREVIRSALALKLHCFEDTGAIIAATTTSLPEHPGSGRNWDYRYCWLRDAFYTLSALRSLGHFEEREHFLQFLLNIAAQVTSEAQDTKSLTLAPLYRIDGQSNLEEWNATAFAGWDGVGPVRVGNAAAVQEQHDVYGEMVLALAPIFFDERYRHERTPQTLELLVTLAEKGSESFGKVDAGIWEMRKEWTPRTFSSAMCWAAVDRVATILRREGDPRASHFEKRATAMHEALIEQAFHPELQSFVESFGGTELDASLLQLQAIRFLPPDDPRMQSTVLAIEKHLLEGEWVMRYRENDGLGRPETAFVFFTFWLIEALAFAGHKERAREWLNRVVAAMPKTLLMSEDFHPQKEIWYGNFPQAYSHVGLVNAAFAVSPHWREIL